jgi:CheY-like chemotaxis protein/HPt (histidine-containing phosphotransfer) domain-containing protein
LPSYGRRVDGQLAREAGIAAYLQKPVRQSQLYKCLVSVMIEPAVNHNIGVSNNRITQHSLRTATSPKNSIEAEASKGRVLVAEDNTVNQIVALKQLQSLGYTANVVSNGREAVQEFKRIKYDVVFMDCQMPEMDGFEATAEIRRFEGSSDHTLIIAMTANAFEGEREKCLAAGMDDYLSKPVKSEMLLQMLERWQVDAREHGEILPNNSNTFSQENMNEVVDLSALANFREFQQPGEKDLVNELIDLFIEDANKRLSILKKAVLELDVATIKRQAHNLKGGAGNIGAHQMAALSSDLEQKADNINEVEAVIFELESEFKKVVRFLDLMEGRKRK